MQKGAQGGGIKSNVILTNQGKSVVGFQKSLPCRQVPMGASGRTQAHCLGKKNAMDVLIKGFLHGCACSIYPRNAVNGMLKPLEERHNRGPSVGAVVQVKDKNT